MRSAFPFSQVHLLKDFLIVISLWNIILDQSLLPFVMNDPHLFIQCVVIKP